MKHTLRVKHCLPSPVYFHVQSRKISEAKKGADCRESLHIDNLLLKLSIFDKMAARLKKPVCIQPHNMVGDLKKPS